MLVKFVLAIATFAASVLLVSPVQAQTLAVAHPAKHHRASHAMRSTRAGQSARVPSRGMSMTQVERRYGAPVEKLSSAGGDTPRHPPINRWRYDGYTVYFERNRVIHSVSDMSAVAPKS